MSYLHSHPLSANEPRPRPRLMLYCQYLSGMGHLVRSAHLARELARDMDVYFVQGGPAVAGFRLPARVHSVPLHPVWLENGELRAEATTALAYVRARRRRQLLDAFDAVRPDVVITEFFPFGRAALNFELLPWMRHIRESAPSTLVVSSVRDTIGTRTLRRDAPRIVELLNAYFDIVLYHSDPRLQRFSSSFPLANEIQCPVRHTGLVTSAAPPTATLAQRGREPLVLVSVGGGRLGHELLSCMLEVARNLESELPHRFELFAGPFMPENRLALLRARARGLRRASVTRFTYDLGAYMQRAELSVSLGGYNTILDVLRTRARALLVPMGHHADDREQAQRCQRLGELGVARVLEPGKLQPELMTDLIRRTLCSPPPPWPVAFNLNGAQRSREVLSHALRAATVGRLHRSQPHTTESRSQWM